MWSKELYMQEKGSIIKPRKQKKNMPEIVTVLGVAKSTVWYILRKKESTGELSNAERPGRPRKTTVVDDGRIISMVKRNPITTANQVNNTLQEIGVSISKSTIKRRLHESISIGYTARCKPLISLKNRKARLDFAKKHLKKPAQFWKNILWTDETKINLNQNDGKRKVRRRRGETHDPKNTTSSVKHCGGSEMAWACMATSGTGTLVFIDDVTQDRSSPMNSEVFRDRLSAQIQVNADKLIGRLFIIQMDNDPKRTAKATQEFIKAKKWN
uniref:Transposase Tc1-like domain-containing protein n=1 Tax=Oryzias sinensis TaxID=183150 RepID=A0A8C7X7Z9_9TELE